MNNAVAFISEVCVCCRPLMQPLVYPRTGGFASFPDTVVVTLPTSSFPIPYMFAAGSLLGIGVTG